MFYGPVGTKVKSVEVNGTIRQPYIPFRGEGTRWGDSYRELPHFGRPVVQVPIWVEMQDSASITVTFEAAEGQRSDSFGPFAVNVTPTVRTTPVTVSTPGCE